MAPTQLAARIPQKIGLNNVPNTSFPAFTISGFIPSSLTDPTGFNVRQNSYVPSDVLTWVHGKHIVKTGIELPKQQVNNIQP